MNSPENLEKLADTLKANGYDVEPGDAYLDAAANRLRNAGFKVTKRGQKDAAPGPADDDQQGSGARTGAQSRAAKKTPAGQSPPQETQGAMGSTAAATN